MWKQGLTLASNGHPQQIVLTGSYVCSTISPISGTIMWINSISLYKGDLVLSTEGIVYRLEFPIEKYSAHCLAL